VAVVASAAVAAEAAAAAVVAVAATKPYKDFKGLAPPGAGPFHFRRSKGSDYLLDVSGRDRGWSGPRLLRP
jgi:hypothetical protein